MNIKVLWVPFDDGASFGKEQHAVLVSAFELVRAHLEKGENVLIHCRAGVSRSAALTMSYLYWSGAENSFDRAFDLVKAAHPAALPHYLVLFSFKELLGLKFDREAYIEFWLKETEKRKLL